MTRRHDRLREAVERNYPRLGQFFGCYLHEDRDVLHGSIENAIDAAIHDYPIKIRQEVRKELRALLESVEDDIELRKILNDALGVNVYFRKAAEARALAEDVERKLMASIKAHFECNTRDQTAGEQT